MKIAYLFFNGQLRGSKKFYSNLIEKQEGDIYCADGGANIAYQLNLIPKEIYGDLDSIRNEVKEFYQEKNVNFIKFKVEKDYTDSELVLNEVQDKYDIVYCIAGLGGSIDHELTNINLLAKYSNLIFISEKEKNSTNSSISIRNERSIFSTSTPMLHKATAQATHCSE